MTERKNLEKMQEEAVNSARAMYKRRTPQTQADSAQILVTDLPHETSDAPNDSQNNYNTAPVPDSPTQPDKLGSFLSALLEDRERTLILIMIFLLYEDNANPELLLAMLYLISN
ncbi:MAG: hypothetical protein IIZ59_02525 [Clostridia bacterium]|nr:hypothetical protein [Clostridia bacterium]